MVAGREPLYRDLMTWRAIKNALAGLLAGLAGGVLLGVLIVIWGVTLFTLASGAGDWEHVVVYVAIVLLITALTPWLVHGLSAMQRSRLRATLGAEIPAPVRPLGRTWHQLALPPAGAVRRAGRRSAGAPVSRRAGAGPVGHQDR